MCTCLLKSSTAPVPPTEECNPSIAKTIEVNQIIRLLYLMEFGVG